MIPDAPESRSSLMVSSDSGTLKASIDERSLRRNRQEEPYTRRVASVIAFVEDLLFQSRILEAARATGVTVAFARTLPDLQRAVDAGAGLALLDLDSTRLLSFEALASLASHPTVQTVGFLSHVDTSRAKQALEAGCRSVQPRGAFVRDLPRLLALHASENRP